jgi:hypothetical protein
MKRAEIVLLWIGGLWGVVWFIEIANRGKWGSGIASIFAGWLVCGLVWVSLRKWPKRSADAPTPTDRPALWNRAKARFPRAIVASLGYVLAVVFLIGWINARAQVPTPMRSLLDPFMVVIAVQQGCQATFQDDWQRKVCIDELVRGK